MSVAFDQIATRRRENIDALIQPRSVAIVGASSEPRRLGGRTLSYLLKIFTGPLYPVNPRRPEVQGVRAYASLTDLPQAPDLTLILVSPEDAVKAAEDAARMGSRAAIVFASGFSEAGAAGAAMQSQLTRISREYGMRILGPNTNGLLAIPTGGWLTFAGVPEPPLPSGPLAIVSQSGATAFNIYQVAREEGVAAGYWCGTGNEADLTVAEMLEYFLERPDVSVLAAYGETIRDAQRLLAVADRARDLDKPLLFMKVGRSTSGTRAALSHTGSIVGSDGAVDAAFAQHGILRPRSIEQLVRWTSALMSPKRPRGRRVGILTASGGMGIMLADAAEDAGLEVPRLSDATQREIQALVPDFAGISNPVDVTGQIVNDPEMSGKVLRILDQSPEIDILSPVGFGGRGDPEELERAKAEYDASGKPYVVLQTQSEAAKRLRARGIPAFRDTIATMDAAAALVRYSSFVRSTPVPASAYPASLGEIPSTNGFVLEHDARRLLRPFGVPQLKERAVHDVQAAVEAAREIGFPVVLKALSYDYLHKTEAGAVAIGLRDPDAVSSAFSRMERRVLDAGHKIAAFLVQEMAPSGLEMIVGVRRDPQFGPLVSVGLGGTLVEIIAQVASRPAPMSKADAHSALAELCQGRLVKARRGLTPDQQEWLADVMVGVGQAAVVAPQIAEVDLNPVIVAADRIYIVDAAIVISADEGT